jgi:hypothetical protein
MEHIVTHCVVKNMMMKYLYRTVPGTRLPLRLNPLLGVFDAQSPMSGTEYSFRNQTDNRASYYPSEAKRMQVSRKVGVPWTGTQGGGNELIIQLV